ncbi:MAG: hypothetical protein IH627_15625 [Rubrivivax sp.]|nr:hypothetical protein [Rubrivivax sp.]
MRNLYHMAPRDRVEAHFRTQVPADRRRHRAAWAAGQRCLIPAAWYQEPNWETGKHVPWRLPRADGAPRALTGIWSEWVEQWSASFTATPDEALARLPAPPLQRLDLSDVHRSDLPLGRSCVPSGS